MPETRSGKLTANEGVQNVQESSLADIIKEKLNEFKDELLTEIKLLIKSEVGKALKKQKEEFHSAFMQLEKRITKLENDNDDLEQYGRCVCLRIKDVPVANEETAEEVFKKTENLLKKVCPNLLGDPHRQGSSHRARLYVLQNRKKNVVVLWFILLVLSIEHYFIEKRASLRKD